MRWIPLLLVLSRLLLGLCILLINYHNFTFHTELSVVLFSIGLLTDIFDGIIARKLNVSTPFLRRLDSSVDQVFYIMTVAAIYIQCSDFFISHKWEIASVLLMESVAYVISYIKFKKEVATHTLSSKFWSLILFATIVQLMVTCTSGLLFDLCFYVGIITRMEVVSIQFILKEWVNDVPTIYHAIQLRKGKKIKRYKLFNG